MGDGLESLPDDIETLKAALIVARAEAAAARAEQSDNRALIAHLKLQIEKLNRDRHGPRSERTARLLDQLELTLEELESSATEDELTAEMAAAKTTKVSSFWHNLSTGMAPTLEQSQADNRRTIEARQAAHRNTPTTCGN